MSDPQLDSLCINTIRLLSVDGVQKANSGHPGLPLGAAPMAYMLWQYHLRHAPQTPKWFNRDRFVLSAGHGSMLLYSLLHLTGYDVSMQDVQSFRQWGSKTPGHPEYGVTPGVEATTGPLGQGTANAVGMAMAERFLAAQFNRPNFPVIDHTTYALVSDGDLMEGVSAEAASLAGHLGLGKLIYLYDANDISLDGPTSLAFNESVAQRYESYGWQVLHVKDGNNDLAAIDAAIAAAKAETSKPSLIIVKTTIGFGSPNKQNTSASHGSPLGAEEVKLTKAALGFDPTLQFHVPAQAGEHLRAAVSQGAQAHEQWQALFAAYAKAHPELAAQLTQAMRGELPSGWEKELPLFKAGEAVATRDASHKVIQSLATAIPWFLGGDADLSCSTMTNIKGAASFGAANVAGRNIHYGVREHAMGSIANGMAYHGGVRSFVATFFVFSDYMRPPVRLSALNHLPVTYVWTHDSVGLGEDGPTHQPVEHLAALRCMPNMKTMRPCDANETAQAWRFAMLHKMGPVALVLSRQKLPVLDRTQMAAAEGTLRGAYVLSEAANGKPQGLIIATGSEVHLALAAQKTLANDNIHVRVVSMPCWELFAEQDMSYIATVLPPTIKARVAVEAGSSFGWDRWVGDRGLVIGIDRFGASAPGEVIFEKLGLTAHAVAQSMRRLLT